jgi:ElaB/YqjD/DUF883 family membrane-anchored ribosome-binding protein
MDDNAFENKVNRDIDKAKEDVAALRVDAATLGDDGVTGLSRKFEQLTDETKGMVTDAVKTLNKDVGRGLSTYNAKVQDYADRLPGDFGKKAARYPWVTITMSMAFGLLLGVLLKPGRQPQRRVSEPSLV